MKKHFVIYNTATETLGDDQFMTEAERLAANNELRELDSDYRWIPFIRADEFSNW